VGRFLRHGVFPCNFYGTPTKLKGSIEIRLLLFRCFLWKKRSGFGKFQSQWLCPRKVSDTELRYSAIFPGGLWASIVSGYIHDTDGCQTGTTGLTTGCIMYTNRGKLGPHVTQCGLGRGLPSYQLAS